MNIIIDTHVFIWLDTQPEKISTTAMEICQNSHNQLYMSIASVWEMQIKMQLGKLKLDMQLNEMIEVQQQENDLNILNIYLKHIYQLQALPSHHNDPFDRIIIAQSLLENMPIISADNKFKSYAVQVLW
jgi:PIN domain nuclease of toxin-antitoxin system